MFYTFSYQSDLKLCKGSSTVTVFRVAFLLKRTNTLKNPINALGESRIRIEIVWIKNPNTKAEFCLLPML
jgi:hypothetical protein